MITQALVKCCSRLLLVLAPSSSIGLEFSLLFALLASLTLALGPRLPTFLVLLPATPRRPLAPLAPPAFRAPTRPFPLAPPLALSIPLKPCHPFLGGCRIPDFTARLMASFTLLVDAMSFGFSMPLFSLRLMSGMEPPSEFLHSLIAFNRALVEILFVLFFGRRFLTFIDVVAAIIKRCFTSLSALRSKS